MPHIRKYRDGRRAIWSKGDASLAVEKAGGHLRKLVVLPSGESLRIEMRTVTDWLEDEGPRLIEDAGLLEEIGTLWQDFVDFVTQDKRKANPLAAFQNSTIGPVGSARPLAGMTRDGKEWLYERLIAGSFDSLLETLPTE